MQFITKINPITKFDGVVNECIEIKDRVLYICDHKNNFYAKYDKNKWFMLCDNKWYCLGYGANPCYQTDKSSVIDESLFDNIFDAIPEHKAQNAKYGSKKSFKEDKL